jgi:succinate dehydrogenase/fumarate reductase cytochrome b subunit
MKSVSNLETVVHREGAAMTRKVAVTNPVFALWDTQIGKKVVMAVTGVVLVLFVIAHMVGNLKIFAGPDEINAYSRFLREVGMPELGYGQLLWVVRIVLLICVILHITAAIQLTRMSWAARPIRYNVKRNIETTFAARVMRWGGLLLAVFVVFHLLHLTGGLADHDLLHRGDGCTVPAPQSRNLEHAANTRLEHGSKRGRLKDFFACHRCRGVSGIQLGSGRGAGRVGQLKEEKYD